MVALPRLNQLRPKRKSSQRYAFAKINTSSSQAPAWEPINAKRLHPWCGCLSARKRPAL